MVLGAGVNRDCFGAVAFMVMWRELPQDIQPPREGACGNLER